MGEGLGRPLIAYLDTQVVVWLAEGKLGRLTIRARRAIEKSSLLISPMVLIELQYLFEIGRTGLSASDTQSKLHAEMALTVCTLPFAAVATTALQENWTRDPFDRIIVSQARTNGLAVLVTSDEHIQKNYPKASWD